MQLQLILNSYGNFLLLVCLRSLKYDGCVFVLQCILCYSALYKQNLNWILVTPSDPVSASPAGNKITPGSREDVQVHSPHQQPKNLQQEFTLVNFHIPHVSVQEVSEGCVIEKVHTRMTSFFLTLPWAVIVNRKLSSKARCLLHEVLHCSKTKTLSLNNIWTVILP